MCWMAAIPVALAAAQSVNSSRMANQATAAQNDAMRAQSMADLKAMNINNADDTLRAKAALEDASNELTGRNMQQVQAMGTLRAAIGESGLEGNSMQRLERITEGQYIRDANSVTDAYSRDYASIFAGQVGRTENTKDQIDARNRGESKGISAVDMAVSAGLAGGSAAASQYAAGKSSGDSKTKSK